MRHLIATAIMLHIWTTPFVQADDTRSETRPRHDDLVSAWLTEKLPALVSIFKHLHANPELSLCEERTAALVADHLRQSGYEVTTGVGGHGVVGVLRNGPGPVVLIRGDMDALPIIEETGLDYASRVRVTRPDGSTVGVMHACGHDIHTTTLLGTAGVLGAIRGAWQGTVVIVAQPAEEVGRGARMMIADGLFDRFPRPNFCFALHVSHKLPAGQVAYTPGWSAANVDSVDIIIHGRGGHGARPNTTVDPVVAAAHVITQLQTLVSRRVNPVEPAVVTVGSIHGGSKHNVIPDEVTMQLTVRSYTDAVRGQLLDGIREIAAGVCDAFGCPKPPTVSVSEGIPACYNDPGLTQTAAEVFRKALGDENVIKQTAEMGGEDFGLYARHLGVPGLQFSLGTVRGADFEASRQPDAAPLPSLHSGRYKADPEPSIETGVKAMTMLALALLNGAA
jgi:hippurate hydrolase